MSTFRDETMQNPDTTLWNYNADGSLAAKTYADNSQVTYTYTPDGKLETRTWARGIVTTYTYDTADRLTDITYSDNTPSVSFTYDRLGRQTSATVFDGGTDTLVCVSEYEYSPLGQLLKETQNGVEINRYYDTLGRSTGFDYAGQSIQYAYDAYGRFASIFSDNMLFEYSYLPGSRLVNGMTA
jgi:YD repeat-containing protein